LILAKWTIGMKEAWLWF